MEKILLAYSGGLINSVVIHWLRYQRKFRVITFSLQLGQPEPVEELAAQALMLGAEAAHVVDSRTSFLSDFVMPTLKAGARYEGNYLLSTALSRPLIARELVRMAREEGCSHVAHGCASKSNDQVRIETSLAMLAPDLKVAAPRREWNMKAVQDAIAYADRHKLPLDGDRPAAMGLYTRDRNIWGARASGGALEDLRNAAPPDVYVMTRDPLEAPIEPVTVTVGFDAGVPVSLDGESLRLVEVVDRLNVIAGAHAVGRVDHVENRFFVGKVREVYEAPAATVLYSARDALEKVTLDRDTYHAKIEMAQLFSDLVYRGLWFTELREACSAFVNRLSRLMTGQVQLRLYKGTVTVVGLESPYSLYDIAFNTIIRDGTFNTAAMDGCVSLFTEKHKALARVHRSAGQHRQDRLRYPRAPHHDTGREGEGRTGL